MGTWDRQATNPCSESPLATKRISDDIQLLLYQRADEQVVEPLVLSVLAQSLTIEHPEFSTALEGVVT